jgi:hypothetical protein
MPQRRRTLSRAQHVVSTIICQCSGVGEDFGARHFGAKRRGFPARQALQPAHEPYRHTGILPRSSGAVAERVFLVLWKAWYRNACARPHCRRSVQEIKGQLCGGATQVARPRKRGFCCAGRASIVAMHSHLFLFKMPCAVPIGSGRILLQRVDALHERHRGAVPGSYFERGGKGTARLLPLPGPVGC